MHPCMFLSTFDLSLGQSAKFGLAISCAALLGVGWQGGFSSQIFPYVSKTVRYISILGVFIFTRVWSQHLGLLEKFGDSAPFLGVILSIFFVRSFPKEAPKLSVNFISLSIYEQGDGVFSSA